MADMHSESEQPVMILMSEQEALENIKEMTTAYEEWAEQQSVMPGPEVYKACIYAANHFIPEVTWQHFFAQVMYDGRSMVRLSVN